MRVAGVLTAVLIGTAIVIAQPVATALTPQEVADIAQQITVRIDGENTGSGVIIERQGNVYTVVTSWHVVQEEGNYTVYTPDGKKYTFNNNQVKRFPGVDLAVFQFTSNQNYRVAEKGNSDEVKRGTNISVAGYQQGTSDIDFRRGAISRLVKEPKDGYAFVYDIDAFPGMSGGAILDEQGKLVGIHGLAKTRPDTNATTVYGIPLKTYLSLAPSAQTISVASSVNTASKFYLAKTLTGHSTKVNQYGNREGRVNSVAISPDGRTLASSSGDATIKIWNLTTGQEIRTLNAHSDSLLFNSVAISPDGRTLAGGSVLGTIKIWNIATGQEIFTFKGYSVLNGSVAFSPDGRTLASSSTDNTIKIWNLVTGQEIRTLKGHSFWVESVAISPDGRTLASGSADMTIKIWNIATGQESGSFNKIIKLNLPTRLEILTPKGHSGSVLSVAFSPDGRTLASGSSDKTIKIWNIATGREIRTLNGHSELVNSVAFSPDSKTLASGSYDKTIKIWNVATEQEITTLKGHSGSVNSVAFSPDGKTLASGSDDATIKIWQLSE
ncbi:trypsin-like peptidase domain-containing protein [Fortiea sp. LEGE XX443]|uniref:WD40 domain-containing protein n=1 Tax=Fortiea sp. LEGE XX443 TaxID=1828611 RepID=UPI00187EF59B|nr:trypsin-like peptidase domain-containing protein [Fortiea sp. LEGE XX443]MBE9008546.1 trypsin-like peptidase domain-containing protein [Fortiea sp. LEGE XX443]